MLKINNLSEKFFTRVLLAVLGGTLYFLGFVGFDVWPLSWICLVPLFFALEGVTPRIGLFLGWLFGITLTLGGFYWIAYTIHVFAGMPWIAGVAGLLILAALQGSQFALFGLLYVWLRRRMKLSVLLIAPVAFVAAEFVSPQLFPHYFANSQYKLIPLIQMCDVTGVLGLSALLVFANAVIFSVLINWMEDKTFKWKPIAALLATFAVVLTYGYLRIDQVEKSGFVAPKIKFGIAQINMGIYEKARDPKKALRLLKEETVRLRDDGAQIVVWPETGVQRPIFSANEEFASKEVWGDLNVPILTGAYQEETLSGRRNIFNLAALIDENGKILGEYRKVKLLMMGEYIPLGETFPFLYKMMPYIGRITAGEDDEPFKFKEYLLGVNVCYEDILPRLINKMMRHSPNVIVNLTNDNWFGETHEPLQHLVLAALRSVEHRRWLVRSTNTGISAFVDAAGRIIDPTPLMQMAAISSDVPMLSGKTFYSIFGDIIGWLSLLFIVKALIIKAGRSKK